MGLSDFEQRQLEAIERGLENDGPLNVRWLWPPHASVIWVGLGLGVLLCVLITVFSRSVALGIFLAIGAAAAILIVLINRHTRPR
jgi:hypothetical protein